MAISVFIVEDELRVASDIIRTVSASAQVQVLGHAPSLADAHVALLKMRPDILLVDLQLPDGDGTALISRVRAENRAQAILVFTVFGEEERVLRAIEAGADGYLLKGGGEAELVSALTQAAAGESPISPAIARHLLRRVRDGDARPVAAPGAHTGESLSSREIEVLRLVAQGFVAEEIGERLHISVHTVRTHIRNVYGKLHVSRRAQAVVEAQRRGYL